MGVIFNCFSQFIKPVCEEFGFSRRAMSFNQTLIAVFQVIIACFWGQMLNRFSLKKMMLFAAIVCPTAFFLYSFATTLWTFYILSLLVSIGYALLTVLPYTYLVSNWFDEKRGLATGLCFMGSGLGGMIFNPLLSDWIITFGWKRSFQILGIIMFVVVVPCVLLLKIHPEYIGLTALGRDHTSTDHTVYPEEGASYEDVKHNGFFFALCISTLAMSITLPSMVQTFSPHMTDNGYTPTYAAALLAFSLGVMSLGKILLGELLDTHGIRRTSIFALAFGLAGMVSLLFCQIKISALFIILGIGLGCAYTSVAPPVILQAHYGKREFGAIMGRFTVFTNIGVAIGPLINGIIFDTFQSYRPAYAMWSFVLVILLIFFATKMSEGAYQDHSSQKVNI